MRQAFLCVLPVMLAILYAIGVGLFYAIERVGDPGAYITAGLLGITVMMSLSFLERRISELQRQLRDRDAGGEPDAPSDGDRG